MTAAPRPTSLVDDPVLHAFGSRAVRIAEDLRDQIVRSRATEQALREYLLAREQGPVLLTEPAPESVREARAYVRRRCTALGAGPDQQDVLELAASELVSNALRHARPPVSYELTLDDGDLLLVVADADPCPPGDGTDGGVDGEGGRGLYLITMTARSWGWQPSGSGKQVWVRA